MVIHTRCCSLTLIILHFFSTFYLIADTKNSVSFSFSDKPLESVFNDFIKEYEVPIIFSDGDVNNVLISADCIDCSYSFALDKILSKTSLIWKQEKSQFIVFKPSTPKNFGISGFVYDFETGETIPYANVFIPKLSLGNITNTDGTFSISNIPVKTCTLFISYIGYQTSKIEINFPYDEYKVKNIRLKPHVISSEDIWITARSREFMGRTETPGKISFSPRHISTLPNLGEVDIFRSLQLLPGIQFGLGGTSNLYIRGGKPDQNLVLLDGMPIYQTGHMFGFVSGINVNSIKDVQVYKGGFPAKFGGRVSSVIEITSRNGSNLKPGGALYGNLMSQGISVESPIFDRGNWIFSFRTSTNQTKLYNSIKNFITGDNQFDLISESANLTENRSASYSPNFSYSDLNTRFTYLLTPKNTLSISFSAGRDSIKEEREFYGFEDMFSFDSTLTDQKTYWGNQGVNLNWSKYWNHTFKSRLVISNYKYLSNYESKQKALVSNNFVSVGTFHEKNRLSNNRIEFQTNYIGLKNHKVELGAGASEYQISLRNKITDGISDTTYWINQNSFSPFFYLQDKWIKPKNFTLETGLRIFYFSSFSKVFYEPRLAIIKSISDKFSIDASVVRYSQYIHQFVNGYSTRGSDGMWILSDTDIPIISSVNYHLGANWDYNNFFINTEAYYKTTDNLNTFYNETDPLSSSLRKILSGSGNANGIELLIRKKTGKMKGWISYLLSKTTYEFPDINLGKSFYADHDKTHELKLVSLTKIRDWNMTFSWVLSSGRVYTGLENLDNRKKSIYILKDMNKERLGTIHHLDVSISRTITILKTRIHYGSSVYNVYNKNNISHRRYNPFTQSISLTDVSMFGITPTLFIDISY